MQKHRLFLLEIKCTPFKLTFLNCKKSQPHVLMCATKRHRYSILDEKQIQLQLKLFLPF